MVERNLVVYRHSWLVIVSGFFEPLFYLLGIGLGLGGMVPDIQGVSYGAFVAPGLLAASCMNGAMSDGFFNIFFKLHFQKTYDGVLATPMGVADMAFGEMLWALARGSIYAGVFLLVILFIGESVGPRMLLSPLALLAWPAAVLVSAAFAAIALCLTSVARTVQDFDLVTGLFITPMFLFSATFVPVTAFPPPVQWLIQAFPLYHGVEVLRQLTTGSPRSDIIVHVAYLLVVGSIAFTVAIRRLNRAILK
jgi:lipooligosaccharide transport system permease protein